MWLLYVSCAWVAGVFLGSKVSPPLLALSLGLIPFALIHFLPGSKKTLIVAGLCLLALLGGGLRFSSSLPPVDEHSLCFYNDKGIMEIQGMVAEEPDIRDRLCLLTFTASEVTVNGEREEVSGTALIQAPRYPAYRYGDVLKITGKLETPEPFDNFDYKSYLARQGIYSVIYYPGVEILDRGQGFKPWQWIYSLRERLSTSLARALPEPQGSLAQGILLGLRTNIPDSLNQAFSRTGTAHILAISGLNISIVIGNVWVAILWICFCPLENITKKAIMWGLWLSRGVCGILCTSMRTLRILCFASLFAVILLAGASGHSGTRADVEASKPPSPADQAGYEAPANLRESSGTILITMTGIMDG